MKTLPVPRPALLLLAATLGLPSSRAEVNHVDAFARLPVLAEGRTMPLDSHARHLLLQISGKSTFNRRPAAEWLARTLFAPGEAAQDEIFLVNNPEVAEALKLPVSEGRKRYSFAQLEPNLANLERLAAAALKLEEENRSPADQELARLYGNAVEYHGLRTSFDLLRAAPELAVTDAALRRDLGLPEGPVTGLDLFLRRADLERVVGQNRDLPQDQWTDYHHQLARLLGHLSPRLQARPAGPALIPVPGRGHAPDTWISIPEAVPLGASQPAILDAIKPLQEMSAAFLAGEQIAFDLAALATTVIRRRWLYVATLALIILALVPHTGGMLSRMWITGRPPVTNLYTTFVFVSWSCALLGLGAEAVMRNRLGVLIAGIAGLALLLVARRFGTEGDTMGVMAAVLDSNFWLATHVVCISLGYAGCCVAGLLGHIHLVQRVALDPSDSRLKESDDMVHGILGFGLIFSFFGTMLGGIWADQSWGRFWGWDPKENGALVIVLWSAILFHARLCRMIGPVGFSAGSIIGIIWVLLAWLGVNLLGVGLHSYGFTSGIAWGLIMACGIELAFAVAMVLWTRKARN